MPVLNAGRPARVLWMRSKCLFYLTFNTLTCVLSHIVADVGEFVNIRWINRDVGLTLNGHIETAEQRTIIQQYSDWYTGGWWVGCCIWYNEEGPGRAAAPPSPLLDVPNVTGRPSTASVPTLYYSMWPYNCLCTLKGLWNIFNQSPSWQYTARSCYCVHLFSFMWATRYIYHCLSGIHLPQPQLLSRLFSLQSLALFAVVVVP